MTRASSSDLVNMSFVYMRLKRRMCVNVFFFSAYF